MIPEPNLTIESLSPRAGLFEIHFLTLPRAHARGYQYAACFAGWLAGLLSD